MFFVGTKINVFHFPIVSLKAKPEKVLLLSSLTPPVIPGIPVNIPTVLDVFLQLFSRSSSTGRQNCHQASGSPVLAACRSRCSRCGMMVLPGCDAD